MHELLERDHVNSEDLEILLAARNNSEADFILVDVREDMEYNAGHIKGVDILKPTSTFQDWAEEFFNNNKDKTVIFTCRTASRSAQVQNVFRSNGHKRVINHAGGIVTYRGEIEA